MKFQYFTYFLNPVTQSSLFPKQQIDKNKVLFNTLISFKNKPLEYQVGQTKLALVVMRQFDNYIFARLGKRASLKKNLPPEKEFEETQEENWPHCTLIFNLDSNPETGQKILFEYVKYVFPNPDHQLKKLSDEINARLLSSGYAISTHPITEIRKFWETVEEYKNKIEKISFSFNAPNLFNLKNSLENELKEVQRDYSATKANIEFENPTGKLKIPKNQLTEQSVEYITKGGGEYKIKVKGRTRTIISSRGKIKTKEISDLDIDIATSKQEVLFSILGKIFS